MNLQNSSASQRQKQFRDIWLAFYLTF